MVNKKYALRKQLKPRYLPGQVDHNFRQMDFTIFVNHRQNIEFAKAKIDNRAPKFGLSKRYKLDKMMEDAALAHQIDKQNAEMINHINRILVMGGKVDCWNSLDSSLTMPRYLNEIKETIAKVDLENKVLSKLIKDAKPKYPTAVFTKEWKKNKMKIIENCKYPLWSKESRFMKSLSINGTPGLSATLEKVTRTVCFFDIELAEEKQFLGKLVFELYSDYAPKTCANFAAFCRGSDGLSYKGTPFHHIVTNYWCQGGDVTNFDGSGGTSIYGDTFDDENFELSHVDAGVLSMWSNGPNTNNSKFNLTFKCLQTMDKRRVVFGRVINGLQHLHNIEYFGSKYGKPMKKVVVSKCGVL